MSDRPRLFGTDGVRGTANVAKVSIVRNAKYVYEAKPNQRAVSLEYRDSTPEAGPAEKIKRVILCSGKVYYDLLNYRETEGITNAAIIRVE